MSGIDELTQRELLRGLMRGDPATFQAGYSAENAVLAVQERFDLHDADAKRLRTYAHGFADGLKERQEA